MVKFNSQELTIAVHAAMRHASALSFGTMVLPYNPSVVWEERRAMRAGPLLQWFLERDTFEQQVIEQYMQLASGDIRELVAGTGVGKTTVMPYRIACNFTVNGLVLFPNDNYPLRTYRYLVRRFVELGGEVSVALLRTNHYTVPPATPCVYLSSAATFLGRLAARPTLLRDLGIDFIYLDESHERVPAYTFFRYAASAGIIGGVKIFYGTATAAADVSMESTSGRKVIKIKPAVMSVESPAQATRASPLHYECIRDKTLILFATDVEIARWYEYYENHDIPALACRMVDGSKQDSRIEEFLSKNALCVVLGHRVHRTSVTFDIKTVICTGYYSAVETNFSTGEVNIVRRPVTQSLRVQTLGRVNRFQPGTAYYSDVDVSPNESGFEDDYAFYIFLWAQVFSLRVNDPAIAAFTTVTGQISTLAAALLLHSRIPPVLVVPYVGNYGFFSRWAGVANNVLYKPYDVGSDDSEPAVEAWKEFTTGVVPYADEPVVYKCGVEFPKAWQVVPAYVWTLYCGSDASVNFSSARSVVSAASTRAPERTARESTLTLGMVPETPPASVGRRANPLRALRRDSVGSGLTGSAASNTLGVPQIDQLARAFDEMTVRQSMPAIATPPPGYQTSLDLSENTVAQVAPRRHVRAVSDATVEVWRGAVPVGQAVHRVDSDSSDERRRIKLRQVDPVRYKRHKLYPMDEGIFDTLLLSERASSADHKRVAAMLTVSSNITSTRGDAQTRLERQTVMFLSVLRVHNAAVASYAQLAANVKQSRFDRLLSNANAGLNKVEVQIEETARLLQACALESFYVGVDSRNPKSTMGSETSVTPDFEREEASARIMLAFGPPQVVKVLESLVYLVTPYFSGDRFLGNLWSTGDSVFTCGHLYEDAGGLPDIAEAVLENSENEDIVRFRAKSVVSDIKFRVATDEVVYIVTYDVTQYRAVVLGNYDVVKLGSYTCLQGILPKGTSGALMVSVDDGAVVGMCTSSCNYGHGVSLSYFVGVETIKQMLETVV